jgi:lipopolysaccharide transport system ATP-binding protein
MSGIVIQAESLSKFYTLGASRRRGSLRDLLRRGVPRLLRLPSATPAPEKNSFWALKDVSFDLMQGDVLGVIGRNGAGKSTLLKILSRITEPTSGRVTIQGRVGSLLEVGTGFHPELSGRENVFLNGSILGMRRSEIERKFDEIVAFAEVEQFIDTPVKRYSSGMYVRLAFAVAAHLEPEILIVDEVLAVGDAAFQRKCMGKMGDVASQGKTILFVSHNMGAVVSLCNRAILLEKGSVIARGAVSDVAALYQSSLHSTVSDTSDLGSARHYGTGKARFTTMTVTPVDSAGLRQPVLYGGGDLHVGLSIHAHADVADANVGIVIYDSSGYRLIDANMATQGSFLNMKEGEDLSVGFHLRQLLLKPDTYLIGIWMGRGGIEDIDGILYASSIAVEADPEATVHTETFPGPYCPQFSHVVDRPLIGAGGAPVAGNPTGQPLIGARMTAPM